MLSLGLVLLLLTACSASQPAQEPVDPNPAPPVEQTPAPTTAPAPEPPPPAPPVQPASEPFPGKVAYISQGNLWVRAGGAEAQQITTDGQAVRPLWSPDGRMLAYVVKPGSVAIWREGEWRLGDEAEAWIVDRMEWSPDSRYLAVAARPEGKGFPKGIWLLEPDSATSWRRLDLPNTQENSPFNQLDLTWRPDSTALTIAHVEAKDRVGQIIDLPLDGGKPTVLLAETVQAYAGGAYRLASWSPDGQYLAFYRMPSSASLAADGVGLHLLEAGAKEPTRLGVALAYPEWVAWSPDSKRLAYVEGSGRDVSTGKQVVIWTAEGTHRTEGESVLDPAWSIDGSVLWVTQPLPRRVRSYTPSGEPYLGKCPEGEGNPARNDYGPIPTADGGLVMIWVLQEKAGLKYASADCTQVTNVASDFDLPDNFYGHHDWAQVIDWHP